MSIFEIIGVFHVQDENFQAARLPNFDATPLGRAVCVVRDMCVASVHVSQFQN